MKQHEEEKNIDKDLEIEELSIEKPLRRTKEKEKKSTFREIVEAVAIALILAVVIRTFIVGMFWIPSRSMVPTIEVNDRVVVTKFSYWFQDPARGDVIVFEYPLDRTQDFIKRLIGLPGETVEFKDSKLYINGEHVEEPYLPEGLEFQDFGPVEIPAGQYFMCGDNRNSSADSRSWGFVDKSLIIGKGIFVYWPFSRMGGL